MAKQRASNTFSGGLNLDFDLMAIGKDSYILSENGRVIYNDQASISWVNSKGNSVAITLNPEAAGDYRPLGYTIINNLLILYLVREDEAVGEIALITFDEFGVQNSYKTLMSDDSFSDKFTFLIKNQIEAKGVYENPSCHRLYWVDGVEDDSNPPRAFTFKFDGGNLNLASNYSAVTNTPHSVNEQSEFLMGIMKFKQTIGGNIPAGQYVYSYRLITQDGYATPWYPPMLPLFVTQDSINPTNWNEYEMEGTETFVNSGKGNRLQIVGIDDRYVEIEIAYVHYIADDSPFESNIFARTTITGTSMEFDHVSNSGTPIDPLEIPAQRVSFEGAKTIDIKDDVLYKGNVNERFFRLTEDEQEDLLVNLTIEPSFRLMRSDERRLITLNPPPADIQPTAGFDPITHQVPKTGISTKRLNQSHTEDYTVNNDYINYKGTQVSHQYQGFWRGETYRFGIVFFDIAGNPSFTYHLADVAVQNQHEEEISWTRLKSDGTTDIGSYNYGDYFRTTENGTEVGEEPVLNGETGASALARLRILGFKFSGIDITNLKSRISGFMIVRAERDTQILGQGLIMPCVREQGYTTPLPSPTQNWFGINTITPMVPGDAGNTIKLDWPKQSKAFYHLEKDTGAQESDSRFQVRPNTSTLYMPDIDFDIARLPVPQQIDRVKLVGVCSQSEMIGDDEPRWRQYMHYNNYVIQKLDCTDSEYHYTADAPYPLLGDQCEIQDLRLADYGGTPEGKIENYVGSLDFYNSFGIEAGVSTPNPEPHAFFQAGNTVGKSDLYGHGKNRTILLFHGNIGTASSAFCYEDRSEKQLASYFISNYIRPNSSPYGGVTASSIEQTRFISTGHFQPVNNPSIADPDVINDVEVFGGDCFLDYHGFARIYGILLDNTFQDNDAYSDYGMGHLFPLESDIHHPLRQAQDVGGRNPMWPDIGIQPAAAFFGTDVITPWIQNGLFLSWDYKNKDYGQTVVADSNVEEFNISGVLFLSANLREYFGLFSQFKDLNKFPIRWRYSDVKIYGENIDRFRIFLANDFTDLKGVYGPITSSEYIFNQIYSFQFGAFGRLRAFDRGALVDQNLGNLYTGVGSKLDGVDYISVVNGNQHQWSLINSGKALYWVDVFKKDIMRFAQDGSNSISDDRNINSYVNLYAPSLDLEDNPLGGKGIISVFDFENEEAMFHFINTPDGEIRPFANTILYNEITDKFVDTPSLFSLTYALPFKNFVYQFNAQSNNQLWLHDSGPRGSYFGNVFDSKVTVVVNDIPSLAKVFGTIRMNINENAETMIKEIVMETQDQNFIIDMTSDTRWKYLEQILRAPLRTVDQLNRMRGKYIKLTFVFDNSIDERIIFTNLLTYFRPSNRM